MEIKRIKRTYCKSALLGYKLCVCPAFLFLYQITSFDIPTDEEEECAGGNDYYARFLAQEHIMVINDIFKQNQ